MKHILLILAILVCAIVHPTPSAARDKGELTTVVLSANLHCDKCKKKIESNIPFEKGVKDLKVDLQNKTITITFRSDKTDSEKLANAVKKLGYTVLIKEEKQADKQ